MFTCCEETRFRGEPSMQIEDEDYDEKVEAFHKWAFIHAAFQDKKNNNHYNYMVFNMDKKTEALTMRSLLDQVKEGKELGAFIGKNTKLGIHDHHHEL